MQLQYYTKNSAQLRARVKCARALGIWLVYSNMRYVRQNRASSPPEPDFA